MHKASWVLIGLAISTTTALAQPGSTPPAESPEPSPPGATPSQAPPAGSEPAGPQAGYDVDALLARAEAASPTLEAIARGTLRRARRALSLGPTVGGWLGAVPAQSDFEGAVTFGVGFETFKVPVVPNIETLKALVIERAKAKLKDQLLATLRGQQLDPVSLEQLVTQAWEEAIKEIVGLENVRPKVMERPRFHGGFEANRLFQSDAWMVRARLGAGIWKFSLGGSFGVGFGDRTAVYAGVELVTHFLMSKSPRASVVDVFLRADFEMRDRDTNTDLIVLGARYLLDVL